MKPFKNKLLAFLILFLISSVSFAQNNGSITGTVKDKNGESLIGAYVNLSSTNGAKRYAVVDDQSNFNFKSLPSGEYQLLFRSVGYKTSTKSVSVANDEVKVAVELSEDLIELETVVVTGGNPKKKIESSVAITTIDSKNIQQRAPINNIDLLRAIPGLTVESSGGDGPGNVWVRGFPQGGGYTYLGILEDGLAVLPTGFSSAPSADQYYKTDLTIKNVEAVRGGNASIVLANTAGAVINNISYVGAEKAYGEFKVSSGLSQGLYRVDGNTGGSLSKNIQFNIGGHYRTDKGIVPPSYNAGQGGQLKANITYRFNNNKGFFRLYGKYINDKIYWRLPSYYSYDGSGKPTALPNYDIFQQSMEVVDSKWDYTNSAGTKITYDLADAMHTKMGSLGFQFNYTTNNQWNITNNFRYQDNKTDVNSSIPVGVQGYVPGVAYTYLDGSPAVYGANDYNVTSLGIMWRNNDTQIINNLDFKKDINKHSLGLGVGIHQHNVNNEPYDTFVFFQELKPNPRRLLIPAFGIVGNGILPASTSLYIADTRILSSYVTDEITMSDKYRLDLGFRLDNHTIDGKRPYYGLNTDGTPNPSAPASMTIAGTTDYSYSNTNWAFSVGLNDKISENAAMFARLTRAYNTPSYLDYGVQVFNATSIKKRPVYLAELGYKYSNNNWSLFSSVSYSAIKNVSLSILVPTKAGLQALIAFGSTATLSAEYEVAYKVSNNFGLRLTGTLQDSKYTDYKASTNTNPAVFAELGEKTYDFSGNRTERVPVLSTELSANYDFKRFSSNLGVLYTGSRYTSPSDSYELPSYITMRASVGYRIAKSIQAKFWVDNLTNTRALTEGDVRGDQFRDFSKETVGTLMIGRTILPRSLWASISYNFK